MQFKPRDYQQIATNHFTNVPGAGGFIGMGLGKTVSTLNSIMDLMFDRFEINKVLVIAPKLVAESTWTDEAAKWDHTRHLRFSVVLGTQKQRKAALAKEADIYVINRENVVWLVTQYTTKWPFDMIVVDESSSFKSSASARFKALRKVLPFAKHVKCLTGTPKPNTALDLWSQVYLLDRGERLEKTITAYREKYFRPKPYVPYPQYEIKEQDGDAGYYERKIYDKIADICLVMKSGDYLDIPKRVDQDVLVDLPPDVLDQYNAFERDSVLELSDDKINAVSAGVLKMKLLQFANGALYVNDKKDFKVIHDCKLERLYEDVESANGDPFLVFYQYQHDLARILEYFKEFRPKVLKGRDQLLDWNKRKTPLLLAHAASAGHGLNMQEGGHLIGWFGVPNGSLELYQQANARLDRSGQTESVNVRNYLVRNTADVDAMQILLDKDNSQEAMFQWIIALRRKHGLS
ncbi:MAG: DEAD/DEAH box helicase [Gammaproteobacteria bacterium]|nr:DEAD/DEAH box helicase [Gammaproteobacteria bacterium]